MASIMSDTTLLEDDTSLLEGDSKLDKDSEMLKSDDGEEKKDKELTEKDETIGEENLKTDLTSLSTSIDKLNKITPLLALESTLSANGEFLNKTATKLLMKAIKVTEEDMEVKLSEQVPPEEAFTDAVNKDMAIKNTVDKIRHYVSDVVNDVATVIKACGFSTLEASDTKNVSLYNDKYKNIIPDLKTKLPELTTDSQMALASFTIKDVYVSAYGATLAIDLAKAYQDVENSVKNIELIYKTIENWTTIAKHIEITANSLLMTLDDDLLPEVLLSSLTGKIDNIIHMQVNTIHDLTMNALDKLLKTDSEEMELPPGTVFGFNPVKEITQGFYIPENLGLFELDHITKINNKEESLDNAPKIDLKKIVDVYKDHIDFLYNKVLLELPVDNISTSFGIIANSVIKSGETIHNCIDRLIKHASINKASENGDGFNDLINDFTTIYTLTSKMLVVLALFAYVFETNIAVINKDIEVTDLIADKLNNKINNQ